jgi:hypothetical protein
MMVFAFMLLLSAEQEMASLSGHKAPQQHEAVSRQSLKMLSENQIGRLEKKDGHLWIVFEGQYYHPLRDLQLLVKDQRLALSSGSAGNASRALFIDEVSKADVLLGEYLMAFQHLSQKGIQVAFVKRVM